MVNGFFEQVEGVGYTVGREIILLEAFDWAGFANFFFKIIEAFQALINWFESIG